MITLKQAFIVLFSVPSKSPENVLKLGHYVQLFSFVSASLLRQYRKVNKHTYSGYQVLNIKLKIATFTKYNVCFNTI